MRKSFKALGRVLATLALLLALVALNYLASAVPVRVESLVRGCGVA